MPPSTPSSTPSTRWVRDPRALESLGSPTRQRLLDRLEALGPSTAGELAASLGLSAHRLGHHLRLLERRGLLVERPRRGDREPRYALADAHWHVHCEPHDARNAEAVRKLTGSQLRQAMRDFEGGLRHPATTTDGARRNLWSLRLEARLSPAELEELNGHLRAVVALLRRPRAPDHAGRLCALSWVLAPLDHATPGGPNP